ncbi:hypothetical protein [Mediterraneibacter gnavus]|uniref:hypothetical protein n=1 Tax=Mediterraneibacter gnavus TaxID=33038 RepID=UPI001FA995DC
MQEQIFVHGYFERNKGILTGFVIFSIMSGTSYMLWSFLFEQASGFAGGTADTSIQQLCLSAGLCLLYFVVSQQLLFSEKVVKTDQYTIETGCISCADEKRCGKVYGEKQRGISVCVKQ